jgi:twinkle protein
VSSDAFTTYEDGGTWCFSCQDPKNFSQAGKVREQEDDFAEKPKKSFTPIKGHYADLTARGITEETCKKCDYQIGETESGKKVHIQLIKDDNGRLIDQKTRDKDKQFAWVGGSKYAGIIGSWSWPAKGKSVVITEGEIDRMSISQAFENRWPTGSLPNGASTAKKAILADYEKLCRFDSIILCFDNDEPGQEALKVACELLPVGKVKIMTLPKKDANAVLMDKTMGPAVLVRSYWDSTPYRPDGIREGAELTKERLKTKRQRGYSLPFPGLNAALMGLRPAEITMLTAGSGIGKSTLARQLAYHLTVEHGLKIGNVYLEEGLETTAAAYVALHAGVPLKRLLDDPECITDQQWDVALAQVVSKGMYYDHFGSLASDRLLTMMGFMAASGCQFIVLDHVSIVVSGMETQDERRDLDVLMTKLASFVKETGVGVIAIAHLKRSQKNFNEGGQVSLNDLRGSAALEQLSFNVVALERNQQDPATKHLQVLRVLKCRVTGETGEADTLSWNAGRGCYEATAPADLSGVGPQVNAMEDLKF